MKFVSNVAFWIVFLSATIIAEGPPNPVELGFADCHTLRAAKVKGQPQERVPRVVIRFVSKDGNQESFAVSSNDAYVSVPLRPGSYCFEAYDRKGSPLELDSDQARCFDVRARADLVVGVVLAGKPH